MILTAGLSTGRSFSRYNASEKGRFLSGQRGRTVNPLAQPSQVRILFSPPSFAKVLLGKPVFKVAMGWFFVMVAVNFVYGLADFGL